MGEGRHFGKDPAQREGHEDEPRNDPALPRGRDEHGDEHAVERDAQSEDHAVRQDVAEQDAGGVARGPAEGGRCGAAETVPDRDRFVAQDGGTEDLIGDAEGHDAPLPQRRPCRDALAQGGAHEDVPGVDDEGHDEHGHVGRLFEDQPVAGELAGGRPVEEGRQEPLERRDARLAGSDAEGDGYGEVADGDGDGVAQTVPDVQLVFGGHYIALLPKNVAQKIYHSVIMNAREECIYGKSIDERKQKHLPAQTGGTWTDPGKGG